MYLCHFKYLHIATDPATYKYSFEFDRVFGALPSANLSPLHNVGDPIDAASASASAALHLVARERVLTGVAALRDLFANAAL